MLGLFTVVLFVAFLAFVATAPTEAIQIFLMFAWIGMLIPLQAFNLNISDFEQDT
ncbi:MAG TPA: hypothetical protein VFS89_08315 [Nitrosospira sp.]|nr:hypothetical protein [Nitrosospira sp.]